MSSLMGWSGRVSEAILATVALTSLWSAKGVAGQGASFDGGSAFSTGGHGWMNAPGGASAGAGQSGTPGSVIGGGFGGAGAAGSGSNYIDYNPPIYYTFGPYGPIVYSPPIVVVGPGGMPPVPPQFFPPMPVGNGGRGGMMLPMPPRAPAVTRTSATPRRPNPARAREYVEVGDRSFRGDNNKRAEERYRLAIKADPKTAAPHVRLAQVALVRGRYADAANHLRDAVSAEPGFLLNAPDIQAIYAEPGDFARTLANLEKHLQADPGDRDAWFVLGAEWYLSGRTQKAADAFRRLTDRRPDLALAAFLDATSPRRKAPAED